MISCIVASPHLPVVGETVRSLLAQTEAARISEILICGADRHGVLPHDPRVRTLDGIAPGPACRAYNAGLAEARCPTVVIVDGDCVLAPNWLTVVRRRHEAGWDGVCGGVEVPPGSYWATVYNLTLLHDYLTTCAPGPRPALPTMNLSLRRAAIDRAGPVPETMPRLYDIAWTRAMSAAGYRLWFEPAAAVRHYPCGITPAILWRTWYAGGACSQAVRRDHPDVFGRSWLLDHPGWLAAAAPLVAIAATARIVSRRPRDRRLWACSPAIWATKVAWCLGASHGRRHGAPTLEDYVYRAPVATAGRSSSTTA